MRHGEYAGERLILAAGALRDRSPFLRITEPTDLGRAGRVVPLAILAEPVEPTAEAAALSAAVIEDVRRRVIAGPGSAEQRLQFAYDAANGAVRAFNLRSGAARRTLIGLSSVVAHNDELSIALAAPGQVVVRQDGQIFAFPSLDSWTSDQVDELGAGNDPLGHREEMHPGLLTTRWAAGDVVLVADSRVASCLAPLVPAVRAAINLDDVLTTIGAACDRHDIQDGHLAIIAFSHPNAGWRRAPTRQQRGGRSRGARAPGAQSETANYAPTGGSNELSNWSPSPLDQDAQTMQTGAAHGWGAGRLGSLVPGESGIGFGTPPDPWRVITDEFDLLASPGLVTTDPPPATPPRRTQPPKGRQRENDERLEIRFSGEPDRFAARAGERGGAVRATRRRGVPRELAAHSGTRRRPVGGKTIVELLAGLILSLTAAVVGVWQVTRRGDAPGIDRDASLGLPHVDLFRKTSRPPRMARLRAASPRLEVGRAVLLVLALLVAGLVAFYVYSQVRVERVEQVNTFEADFQAVLTRHAEAQAAADPATAFAVLIDARRMLQEVAAGQTGAVSDPRIESERATIEADLERLAHVERFTSVQAIGSVPGARDGVVPRLIAGGGRVYVLTDALYQLDGSSRELIRLLGEGDVATDAQQAQVTVGTLRGAAWRDDRIMAVDALNAYVFDAATGTWSSEPLGTFDAEGFSTTHSVDSYGRNLYFLSPADGQILKFAAGAYDGRPEDWTAGLAEEELRHAVDLAIDGHVFVLLDDGRVLSFFMAGLESIIQANVVPPIDRPVAVAAPPNSAYIYALDGTDGRLFRITRDGSAVQQFLPERADVTLADAQDFVIDEGSGIAFILAHNAIYTVRVPAAPAPPATPTPTTPTP